MECLECLSKGDLGPFHHHYLVHSKSYIITLGEWLLHGLEAEGLAKGQQVESIAGQGLGQQVGYCPVQCLQGFIVHLLKVQDFLRDGHIWESTEKGRTTKLLFLFFCFVLSYIFCCFGVYVWGYKSNFLGVLVDLLNWYLVLLASLESLAKVGQVLGVMSLSGKLSG